MGLLLGWGRRCGGLMDLITIPLLLTVDTDKAEQMPRARYASLAAQALNDVEPARRKTLISDRIADRGQTDADFMSDPATSNRVADQRNRRGAGVIHAP